MANQGARWRVTGILGHGVVLLQMCERENAFEWLVAFHG